ncbi:MAG: Obg family GTPase CgtA, partial [Lachnospiraceae bacterium]|nr:Obg family GTPase CgtA [Lachnospiraceae bacterium]
ASVEGRDPVEDVYTINRELKAYRGDLADRPQVIAANKLDVFAAENQDGKENPLTRLKNEFEPKGIPVFGISAVSGQGVNDLLRQIQRMLKEIPQETTIFEPEYDPESSFMEKNLPFTVEKSTEEAGTFLVEGPRIERMLGYTNLESEKGFQFFQNFLRENGILKQLEALGIQDGDTVRMYGLQFDYYKE